MIWCDHSMYWAKCDWGQLLPGIPLVEILTNHLTYVGTVWKNNRDIPAEMQPNRQQDELTSVLGFTDQLTLVSYVPKKHNAKILLPSMHHDEDVVYNDITLMKVVL